MKDVTIICREVNQVTGDVSVSKCKENPPTADYENLKLRQIMNPTLQYFVVFSENWEKFSGYIKAMLEKSCECKMAVKIGD